MAGGSYTKVVFGALEEGEADLKRAYSQATHTVETLLSQLHSSLSMWSGSAQAAYTQVQQTWNQASSAMNATIASLGNVVGTANTNYMSTENANTQLWS